MTDKEAFIDDFTITFWIKAKSVSKWRRYGSVICFPKLITENGIQVYFKKVKTSLKIFIIHPVYCYQKLSVNIKDYIKKDTFVLLTFSEGRSTLYLNSNKAGKNIINLDKRIEVGDFVLVKLNSKDLIRNNISSNLRLTTPAIIKKIKRGKLKVNIFELKEVIYVNKSQIFFNNYLEPVKELDK